MLKIDSYHELSAVPLPAATLLVVLLFSIGGFLALGPILGIIITLGIYDISFDTLTQMLSNPINYPQAKTPILIIQGSASLVGFILVPWFYLRYQGVSLPQALYNRSMVDMKSYLLSFFIALTFLISLTPVVLWNETISFPEFLSGFEVWAKEKELQLMQLTEYLTLFDHLGQFVLATLVIAIIPAIGEEFLFRGVIQNQLNFISKNIHLSIWITAFFFSAFHLQFYGFLPRMMLGALFGYLYYWSGNLFIPIFAHFVNNGLSLLMVYLYQLDKIQFDIESTEEISYESIIFFILLSSTLIIYFRAHHKSLSTRNE